MDGFLLHPLPICRKDAISGEWYASMSNKTITARETNNLWKQSANCSQKDGDHLTQAFIETRCTNLKAVQDRLQSEERKNDNKQDIKLIQKRQIQKIQ
eukprot:7282998-Ditylum_brightwellii.AAC.1